MLCDKDGLISERTYFQFGQQAILKIINNVNILNFSTQSEKVEDIKGQLISKRFLAVVTFLQKTNENMSHTSENEFILSFFGGNR